MSPPVREKLLVAMFSAVVLPVVFVGVSTWAHAHNVPVPSWLLTALDGHVSVVPSAVWLYASWYVAPASLLLLPLTDFRRGYGAELVAFVICTSGHLLLPVAIDRPPLDAESTSVSVRALAMLYRLDVPSGLFPSFHAAVAAVLWRVVRVPSPLLSGLFTLWMFGIAVSCCLTGQHYVVDVIAGWIVGIIAVRVADAFPFGASLVVDRSPTTSSILGGSL